MPTPIEVTAEWASSRLEIFPVRMACGCIVDRKMRPETAAQLRRNEAGEIYSDSKCINCDSFPECAPSVTGSASINGSHRLLAMVRLSHIKA